MITLSLMALLVLQPAYGLLTCSQPEQFNMKAKTGCRFYSTTNTFGFTLACIC